MTDLTDAIARLKELGMGLPRTEKAMKWSEYDRHVRDNHVYLMSGWDTADAALLELLTLVERQQRMLRLAVHGKAELRAAYTGVSLEEATRLEVADLAARAEEEE